MHSRLNQHDKALEIYAVELKDDSAALKYANLLFRLVPGCPNASVLMIRYCEEHYSESNMETHEIFSTLLKLYLQPPKGGEVQIGPALELLTTHYTKLNKGKVRGPVFGFFCRSRCVC